MFIRDSHGKEAIDCGILGCDIMWSCRRPPLFWRNSEDHLQKQMVSQLRRLQLTDVQMCAYLCTPNTAYNDATWKYQGPCS